MGYVQQGARRGTEPVIATRSAGRIRGHSRARPTQSGSCARSRWTSERGNWIDPRDADLPLAVWAETFLSLCATALADDPGDVPPRISSATCSRASVPTGSPGCPPTRSSSGSTTRSPSGIAPSSVHRHYRTLRRMLAVAVEKQKIVHNACDRVDPPRVPKREMTFLDWDQVGPLGRGSQRTLPSDDLRRGGQWDAMGRIGWTARARTSTSPATRSVSPSSSFN